MKPKQPKPKAKARSAKSAPPAAPKSPSKKPTPAKPSLRPFAQQKKKKPATLRLGAPERHAAFAREIFAHGNIVAAWRTVYDPKGIRSPKTADASAYKIKRHANVQRELARLNELHAAELAAAEKQAEIEAQEQDARSIATRHEILQFHTRVLRASSSDFSATNRDLIHVVEKKVLAPVKRDKDGEEIENPDADEEGYITMVERAPPSLKDRLAAADAITKMEGHAKADGNAKQVGDALTDLLTQIRGGGTTG